MEVKGKKRLAFTPEELAARQDKSSPETMEAIQNYIDRGPCFRDHCLRGPDDISLRKTRNAKGDWWWVPSCAECRKEHHAKWENSKKERATMGG